MQIWWNLTINATFENKNKLALMFMLHGIVCKFNQTFYLAFCSKHWRLITCGRKTFPIAFFVSAASVSSLRMRRISRMLVLSDTGRSGSQCCSQSCSYTHPLRLWSSSHRFGICNLHRVAVTLWRLYSSCMAAYRPSVWAPASWAAYFSCVRSPKKLKKAENTTRKK